MNILFIGAGSMAEALLRGWVQQRVVAPHNVYVTNRSNEQRLTHLQQTYGVQRFRGKEAFASIDVIVLAMKPKDAASCLETIRPHIAAHTIVLSVLAGIAMETIAQGLGTRPIARVMPNTSASLGMSASGIAFNDLITAEQKAYFLTLLEAVGKVVEVEEDQLHAVTALSGSGPAYIYYVMEAFLNAGKQLGMEQQTVRELMIQTIAGSAAMLDTLGEEPALLRKQVTSPGGTTEAGIGVLDTHHVKEAIEACVLRAAERSRELAHGQ